MTSAALDTETLHEAWLLYKATELEAYRNKLLLHYTSLIRYVVAKKAGHLPSQVDREDLMSYGTFGLLDAIEKFDPERGKKFETYAVQRIWGAILDELRKLSWVPRSVYAKGRDIERVRSDLEAELGRSPRHEEVAQALGQTMPEYWHMASEAAASTVQSTDAKMGGGDDEGYLPPAISDPTANLEEHVETGEIAEILAEAIVSMDERSKTVLVLSYCHEMTLGDIGRLLGVTESRVCQLQGKALGALSESLGQAGLAA